jgi:predicted transcriptional regulator of viral defense system
VGTQRAERRGNLLEVTGPERTLVEGLHRPAHAGGLEELVQSASGFPTLDLALLETVLRRFGVAHLWAATGWFLERFQQSFHVPERLLARCERHRPRSPQYLERRRRGGTLAARWSLIMPRSLAQPGGPYETERPRRCWGSCGERADG